jgi:hypothetical protein
MLPGPLRILTLFLIAVPAMAWFLSLNEIGLPLADWRAGLSRYPFADAVLAVVAGISGLLAVFAARGLLRSLRRRRFEQALRPARERRMMVFHTLFAIPVSLMLLGLGSLLLDATAYAVVIDRVVAFASALVAEHLVIELAPPVALVVALVGFWASAGVSKRRPKSQHKVYDMELYNPTLARWALFSSKRLIIRHLPWLRNEGYGILPPDTVFAGQIRTAHEQQPAQIWHVTFREQAMYGKDRGEPLTLEQLQTFFNAISTLEQQQGEAADGPIPYDDIVNVVSELNLETLAERGREPMLRGLSGADVIDITRACRQSKRHNVLTLDVNNRTTPKGRRLYERRLEQLRRQINQRRLRDAGRFKIVLYSTGRRLWNPILYFEIDDGKTISETKSWLKGRTLSARRLLVFARVQGPSGALYADDEIADDEAHIDDSLDDDFDLDIGGDDIGHEDDADVADADGIHSGAQVRDHVKQVPPSLWMRVGRLEGMGRVYRLVLGKTSYLVITKWLASFGSWPPTGWRPLRVSRVTDQDGKLVARRYQHLSEFLPHLFGLFGLGKEYSHCEILDPALYKNDKLPLALLALDMFESNEYRHRRRILKTYKAALRGRRQVRRG